jgi:RND superfamily putative drug exporter
VPVWKAIARFTTAARTKWVVVAFAVLFAGVLIAAAGSARISDDPTSGLSSSAESNRVAALQAQLPGGSDTSAIVLYSRNAGVLGADDLTAIAAQRRALAPLALRGAVSAPVLSEDEQAALVAVPLNGTVPADTTVSQVKAIRQAVATGLPAGLTAQVTGPAAVTADLAGVFSGANVTLLLATIAVVAFLLIFTYRSPWLWLIPLAVVGMADQVTTALVSILSRHTGLDVSSATTGIVEVLVFGAGTDYALLLIARYREQLREHEDRHEAMYLALLGGGPAILASGSTVAVSLASLVFATLPSTTGIGVAGAVGIVCALAFGLLVLPSVLLLFGRSLFWPLTPRPGQPDTRRGGVWHRVGAFVSRRPQAVIAGSLLLVAVLAAGLSGARFGLSQSQQFRTQAPSIEALATLQHHFPVGESDPVVVIASADHAPAVLAAARQTPGVTGAQVVNSGSSLDQIDVIIAQDPDTAASYSTVEALRTAVHAVPGADALVGGTVATALDTKNAAAHDQRVIIPLVLGIVLLILILLLRSLVAPIILVATVVASFFAALGAANFAFGHWFGYPALDTDVPLLSFLFLVALGVDYNIFLITRARQQAATEGTRKGIITALTLTGGVITSAGILLAAVFAVLGVLPLITLTELGIIVGFGVLLDTLVVRTVLVPAIVTVLGDRFWWPANISAAGIPAAPITE